MNSVKTTLYIPESVPQEGAKLSIQSLKELVATRYGGYTLVRGEGGWRSTSGHLQQEKVVLLSCIHQGGVEETNWWCALADKIRVRYSEECVLITEEPIHAILV